MWCGYQANEMVVNQNDKKGLYAYFVMSLYIKEIHASNAYIKQMKWWSNKIKKIKFKGLYAYSNEVVTY